MRLDKYLANAGIGTRKEVKSLIRDKRITVDGQIVKIYDYDVNFSSVVALDGNKINYKEFYYILLNKPKGYISATQDNFHPVVLDLIPEYKKFNVAPVGRLDIDTTGVMLLTNHGSLAHVLLSPKNHIDKTYLAEVNHPLNDSLILEFEKGVTLDDGYVSLPAKLEIIDQFHAKITIHEGKFHQVKRMFKAFGYEVINLERTSFGFLSCDNLKLGEYRELSDEETSILLHLLN